MTSSALIYSCSRLWDSCSKKWSKTSVLYYLNNAMNHTKLNFGKIVSSKKKTEKNCAVIKRNTYLNNKTLKEIGSMQYFSVQRLCLILLNMYSLFLCISSCASPLIITIRHVLLCEINLTYLLTTETNRIHFITFLYTACFYTDPFRYQFPSFFSAENIYMALNGFICNTVGGL